VGSHPLNLALRFLLELSGLVAVGMFGWIGLDGAARWGGVIGFPLAFATLWGIFNVPDDPSRSGAAPVRVPGIVRLGLELTLFAAGAAALYLAGYPRVGIGFGTLVLVHYVLSWDRIAWLLKR
jgi:hypothetical protein